MARFSERDFKTTRMSSLRECPFSRICLLTVYVLSCVQKAIYLIGYLDCLTKKYDCRGTANKKGVEGYEYR